MRRQFIKSGERRYDGNPLPLYAAIALWVAIAGLFATILGGLNVPIYYDLARHAETGRAKIIKTDSRNHCSATYQFTFETKDYTGGDSRCDVKIGDELPVFFNPAKPSNSTTHEPNGALLNELIPIGFASLILPTLIVYNLCLSGFFGRRREVSETSQ